MSEAAFADYLAYIYAHTPDHATEAKDFLLQNMYEEELSDVRHTDLLIRFAEACGTTRERVMDERNMNAVTRGRQGWCYAVAMREHFAVATAALVVGLESQVPSIYRTQYPPLIEAYGFGEDDVEFFDLHITSDEVHGERGYQIVLDHADTRRCSSVHSISCGLGPRCGSRTRSRSTTRTSPPTSSASDPSPDRPRTVPTIRYVTSGCAVEFADGDDVNMLRVAIRNECHVPYRCASGNCGTDRVHVEEGHENLSEPRKRERERLGDLLDDGWRLACQTYVSGDCSVTWDPDQTALDERATDKSLPAGVNERLARRWLSAEDTD